MSEFVESLEEGFGSASERTRLEFLAEFVAGCQKLVDGGAHKPFIRRMMRVTIAYQWERPLFKKSTPLDYYSLEARKFASSPLKVKRNKLRRDHAIPLGLVIHRLLKPGAPIKWLLKQKTHLF